MREGLAVSQIYVEVGSAADNGFSDVRFVAHASTLRCKGINIFAFVQ